MVSATSTNSSLGLNATPFAKYSRSRSTLFLPVARSYWNKRPDGLAKMLNTPSCNVKSDEESVQKISPFRETATLLKNFPFRLAPLPSSTVSGATSCFLLPVDRPTNQMP
uniref:Uncharacterized protein n=1 Tax=Anopheles christyi TaxID=43041 RepID=A0A182KI30_9DIPT